MPKKRQKPSTDSDLEESLDIRSLAIGTSAPHTIHKHSHDWHQLIYASRGVMTVNTATGSWVVPSRRAVWVPANETHEIRMTGSVSLRTLYLKVNRRKSLPTECCVMNVSPLLRELILHTIQIG